MTDPIAVPHTNTQSTLAATTPSSLASSEVVDYLADPSESQRDYQKRYYATNSDKIRERQRRYYAANREKAREQQNRYRATNSEQLRENRKRWGLKGYSITSAQYKTKHTEQGGVCVICKHPNQNGKRLSVDHDHRCCPGKQSCGECVRGLLCSTCNIALGLFKDSPELLFAALAYILKHAEKETQTTWQQPRLEHQQEHPL